MTSKQHFPALAATVSSREDAPSIPTRSAFGLLVLYTIIYIAPLYALPSCRPSATRSRDDPDVIRARVRSVALSCVACLSLTVATLSSLVHLAIPDVLHVVGVWPVGLGESVNCLLLTAILFIGPMFDYFVAGPGLQVWATLGPLVGVWRDLTLYRTIFVGPLTEELLFRSCAVPLLLVSRVPLAKIIFFSPLVFGLAHIHHFYEFRLTHPHIPLVHGILRSVFQIGFTTLFGAFATFVFVRSGSLLAAFVIHAFCNSMGFPRVGVAVHGPVGPPWLWTAIYHILLVVGATLFSKGLWYFTESDRGLI